MAVGLKTLLEAAQFLEEQEQKKNSPLSAIVNSNHINGGINNNHSNNDSNRSCFIAHYSVAVSTPKNSNNGVTKSPTASTTTALLGENNDKLANIEDLLVNGHEDIETADNFAVRNETPCQTLLKNTGIKKQQQIVATSAPASTGFQQVAVGNGFSLTAKTKSPTELLLIGSSSNNKKDVHENNNNNKCQLLTGAITQQQQINNHHSTLPTNNINTSNILNGNNINYNNNINHNNDNNTNNNHKIFTNNKNSTTTINVLNNIIANNNNEDFDTNSLSPPGPQRVRSASTSSNVYVFGSLDHTKSAATHVNRLQTNVLQSSATESKGLQMMLLNETTCTSNLTSWMINHSPQRNNSMEVVSSIGSQMEVMSPKSFATIGSQSHMSIPSIANSGRRRTMSSTSNGAGTREVHNKLEKNRRAHLKECYEKLKSQLNLKDEDRKKTSNLAVLGEALNQVIALKKQDQDLEAKIEQLAKDKINSQKRIFTLKRELGPRYEQIFSGIFPDNEITMTSIPNERDNFSSITSLSSARGGVLYSSSNSLSSSGGSSLLSSPGGVNHLQTNSTTIIPVIPKTNMAGVKMTGIINNLTTTLASSHPTTGKSSDILLQQNNMNKIGTNLSASSVASSPASPTSTVVGVNNLVISTSSANTGNLPLSLTAKNISDTSLTRGSPTPSTPSPSPSSSSGVSSSSSFISSSPPIANNGITSTNVNGNTVSKTGHLTAAAATTRQVCINIPNGLKFHIANGGAVGTVGSVATSFQGTIGNGTVTTASATALTNNNSKNGNYHP